MSDNDANAKTIQTLWHDTTTRALQPNNDANALAPKRWVSSGLFWSCVLPRQVDGAGAGQEDDGMGAEEDDDGAGGEAGGDAEVEDMAGATFEGHSDAVYCVAVNPKNHSQVTYLSGERQ